MSTPTAEIFVSDKGDIEVDLQGFQGPGCADVLKEIEALLGEADTVVNKPEFDARVVNPVSNQQRAGRG